jgi:hypothetical protein
MMRRAGFVILAFELTLVAAYSQTKMEFKDISDPGSPVRVSGSSSFSDDISGSMRSYDIEVHFRNVSRKNVLLVVLRFVRSVARGPSLDYSYWQDYFLRTNVLEEESSRDFVCRGIRFPTPKSTGGEQGEASSAPIATAETVLVQFTDGTTWGNRDADFVRYAFLDRKRTVEELGRLEHILDTQGEAALSEGLSKTGVGLPYIDSLKSDCINKAESCLSDGVRSMIGAANRHRIEMKRALPN